MDRYELVVIGTGPAGLAAGVEATRCGLRVMVLGEDTAPGGQMYRAIERVGPGVDKILGRDFLQGRSLARDFIGAKLSRLPGSEVWQLEPDGTVSFLYEGQADQVRGEKVLIATGARERPMPIPGWTRPGVMAATAADVLLKSDRLVPSGEVILAGSGPLLLLTAVRLIRAKARVKAVLDTTPPGNLAGALPYLPKALAGVGYLAQGLGLIREIRRSSAVVYRKVGNLRAVGHNRLESVSFMVDGQALEMPAETLLLHHGLVPETQLTSLIGADHDWHPVQRYWSPRVDRWGATSHDRYLAAGDATRVWGAAAAIAKGRLAALRVAHELGRISRREMDARALPFRRALTKEAAVRPFLDRLFGPNPELLAPRDDETIVCRCEELTAGRIRAALELGALGLNRLKTQTRAGMGPCQGRMCSLTIAEMIAAHYRIEPSEVARLRVRPPVKPITVAQMAGLRLIDEGEGDS